MLDLLMTSARKNGLRSSMKTTHIERSNIAEHENDGQASL